MWNVKAKVIPPIIEAPGTISEYIRLYLSNIPGKLEIKELQKKKKCWAVHSYCGRCYCMSTNVFHRRNNITCSTDFKYRTAATLYTLGLFRAYNYKYPA
jgi:hypothetical protein